MALSGKVSIVTGASSGLGEAIAILFARQGALVTVCGRDQDRLQGVLESCVKASGGHADRFLPFIGDLTNSGVREDVVSKTIDKFGCLDILVANAGMTLPISTTQDCTEEMFDRIIDANVKSVFFLIQKAQPHLEKSKGNIITISSVASIVAYSSVIYPMSKAAVDHMTKCLAVDLGPKGIRVNAVNPSFIPTRIRRDYPGNLDDIVKAHVKNENLKQPMGECGTPDDVAQTTLFLASDAAKFISGECIFVDGGRRHAGASDTWSSQNASKHEKK